MRRLSTVSLGLFALALFAAMQAAPRLIALCKQECASASQCEMACPASTPPFSSEENSGCCEGPKRIAETVPTRPCQRACAPADNPSQTPCAAETSPGKGDRGRQCRRHPLPCDACIPSQFNAELPTEMALKRPEATSTNGSVDCCEFSLPQLHHLIHTHSPPEHTYAITGAERCLSIRVLLI